MDEPKSKFRVPKPKSKPISGPRINLDLGWLSKQFNGPPPPNPELSVLSSYQMGQHHPSWVTQAPNFKDLMCYQVK